MRSIKTEIGDYTDKHFEGNFICFDNNIESLEGAPKSVGGDFYLTNNNLKSLEGAPQFVGGHFDCYNNDLESLEGAPQYVGGSFDCSLNNNLESLEGVPKSVGGFDCNEKIKQGENLYIIANALLNGSKGNKNNMLETITKCFS